MLTRWYGGIAGLVLLAAGGSAATVPPAYEAAVAAYQAARYEEVLSVLAQLPPEELQRAPAQNLRSLAFLKLGRYDEALTANAGALSGDPGNVNYVYNTSLIHLAKGDTATAEAVLRKAAERAPDSSRLQEGLGETLFAAKRYLMAEQSFREGVRLDPASITAQIGLTKVLYATGNRAAFGEAAARAIRTSPSNPLAMYYYGKFLLDEEGRAEEGAAYIERSCQIAPAFTEGLLAWGALLSQKRRWVDAVRVYEQASRVEPRNARIRYLLSISYRRAGRQDEAQRELNEFTSLQNK